MIVCPVAVMTSSDNGRLVIFRAKDHGLMHEEIYALPVACSCNRQREH